MASKAECLAMEQNFGRPCYHLSLAKNYATRTPGTDSTAVVVVWRQSTVPNSIGEVDLASASCLERFSNGGFDIHQWISLSLVVCDDSTGEECENFLEGL